MNINKIPDGGMVPSISSNTKSSQAFPPMSVVDEKISLTSKKSIPLEEKPVKQGTMSSFFAHKFKVLKQEVTFAVKVFLSLFSREKDILLDLSLLFKEDAFNQIKDHKYLSPHHPNKEKMLNTLEEIVHFSINKESRESFFREVKEGSALKRPCFDWYVDDKKQVFILDKEKNRAFCLNNGKLALFQIKNKSVEIITEEMIIPRLGEFSIDENHVNRFLNLMSSREDANNDMVQNTLMDILHYLMNNSEKKTHSANLRRDPLDDYHSYGWSINPGGKILIRTGIEVGSGVAKKVTQSFCLNNGKIYANLASSKMIFKNISENDKKKMEEEYLPKLNLSMEKSHENLAYLKKLNIPHIPSVPVSGYTKTKLGTEKLISTQKLFQCDGEILTHEASKIDHQAFIEKQKGNIYFAMREVSETLKELHRHKLVHGDVKPLNIGLNFDENNEHLKEVLLIDWDDMTKEGDEIFSGGTRVYLPPERNYKNLANTRARDAYALGVSFAQFLSEEFLPKDQFEKIQTKNIDENLNNLYLKEDEREKVSFILKGLLEEDPNKRMTCAEAHELFSELTQLHTEAH